MDVENNTVIIVTEQVQTYKDLGNTVSNTIEIDIANKISYF
jgi:hypothetical protein